MAYKWILLFLMIFVSVSLIGGVYAAGTYSVEFNQTGDRLVVSENASGNYSSYVDSGNLEKTSSGYVFTHKIVFDKSYANAMIRFNLGEGFVINNQEAYPSNYRLETDGQTISLIWTLQNVSSGDNFAVFLVIKDTNSSWLNNLLLILVVIIALILVGWFVYKKYFKSITKKEGKFEKHLLESEKKVIDELKKAEKNELWQKEIQNRTGFSKAKLSRVIRDLESRGLIKKIPLGNTNKVVLN